MTACEPTTVSEAVVMEPPQAGGFQGSCGAGDGAASLDDVIVDTAKYVDGNALDFVFERFTFCRPLYESDSGLLQTEDGDA